MGNVPMKKVVNSDAGDADHVGGNDWDDLVDFLNNVDKTGPVIINTDFRFRTNKLIFRDGGNDHNYTHVFPNLTGNRIVNWPLLTADDTVTFNDFAATLKNKTIDSTNSLNVGAIATNAITLDKLPSTTANRLLGRRSGSSGNVEEITVGANLTLDSSGVLTASGGGGGGDVTTTGTQTLTNKTIDIKDNSLILREHSYLVFKSGSTYYARNSTTGVLTSNSDFKTLFQAIITAIATRDDTVRTKIKIAPGDYDVNAVIDIHDKYNVVIEGSGMGITRLRAGASLASGEIFNIKGAVSGTQKNLTSSTSLRSKTAVMSSGDAATFSVGDWVLLRSTEQYSTSGSASGAKGELKQIAGIAGGTITFREPINDTYNTGSTANMIKILPCKYITISDLTVGPQAAGYTPGSNVSWWSNIFVDMMFVNNVEVVDFPGQFGGTMYFSSCTNTRVSNCHLQSNIAHNFQYGISFHSACQNCVVSNCTAYGDWRHAFEAGSGETGTNAEGVCRNIKFVNCTVTGGSQNCFDTHPEGEGIYFINCGAFGTRDGGGIKIRSKRSAAIGCFVQSTFDAGSGQDAIVLSDDAHDCMVVNCHVVNCSSDGIKVKSGMDGLIIEGNIIDNTTGDGIRIETGGSNRSAIRNNMVINCDGDGMDLDDVDNAVITGNTMRSNTGYGIRFAAGNCTNNIVVANHFSSNGSGAVTNGGQSGNVEANNFGY